MSETSTKEIAIVMFQYSVVVKGIERKLEELGYRVTTFADHLKDETERFVEHSAMFIFYLPNDVMDDPAKQSQLIKLCGIASQSSEKTILIGESKYHDDLLKVHPELARYDWLDRPVDMKELERAVKRAQTVEEPGRKKRLLIVDDDPSYARMVREWLKDTFRVDIVTAGMQAISFLLKLPEGEKIDLILLDYEMPVVDGPQVLQMLRQEPATAEIPIVFLTGVGTKEAVARVMSLKPDGYILKSTTKADIIDYLSKKLN